MGDAAEAPDQAERRRPPWNRGRLLGQKPPLKLREVWAIRIRLQIAERLRDLALLTTRHYARLMDGWIGSVGLDPALYGTHSLRRTKVALIYRRTGNLRAVQLPLGLGAGLSSEAPLGGNHALARLPEAGLKLSRLGVDAVGPCHGAWTRHTPYLNAATRS